MTSTHIRDIHDINLIWLEPDSRVDNLKVCPWCEQLLLRLPCVSPDTHKIWSYQYHCNCGVVLCVMSKYIKDKEDE